MNPGTLRDWAKAPPYVRWIGWRCLTVAIIFALAALAMAILKRPLGMRGVEWYRWSIVGMGFAPIVTVIPVGQWLLNRTRRKFEVAHGRLCTHCGYNLHSLGDAGLCPECGKDFDIARDAEAWRRIGFTPPDASAPATSPRP